MRRILLFPVLALSMLAAVWSCGKKDPPRVNTDRKTTKKKITDTANAEKPDTVLVGIYINSIHDIDFKQNEFSINFWLWLKYKNLKFDFAKNLEIPNSKTFEKSYVVIDTVTTETGEKRIDMAMKVQAVMKDNWKITNFPFDRQRLRVTIENSQYSYESLVFALDTVGEHFDSRFNLNGWKIDPDSFRIIADSFRIYKTTFGVNGMKDPVSKYASFRVRIGIHRDATGLFWKMFLGMYIAFLIAYICFYIHSDGMDSRFGLSVGSLFAVIGNKYIIDSALPESTAFTLVDTLHGLTLFSIFTVIACTAFSLRLVKRNKMRQAKRFSLTMAQTLLSLYIIRNIYFIYLAD